MKSKDDLIWLRGVCDRRGIPAIRPATEDFLRDLLIGIKPASILEIGTAIGYSSSFMASLLPEARILTAEEYDRSFYDAKEAIARLGLSDRIEQRMGDGNDVMDELIAESQEFDFIFIDAAKAHYREFFDRALKLSHEGTVIACDNVMLKEASMSGDRAKEKRFRTSIARMNDFLKYISSTDAVSTKIYETGDGISVSYVRKI